MSVSREKVSTEKRKMVEVWLDHVLSSFCFLHAAFISYLRKVMFRLVIGRQINMFGKFASKGLCNLAREKDTGLQASL